MERNWMEKEKWMEWGERAWKIILQAFFPLRCPVCDEIVMPIGEKICLECMGRLRVITPPWCMKCGKPMEADGEFCPVCRRKGRSFTRGRALYHYKSAADSIYRFKYGGRREYAAYYGEQMWEYLRDFLVRTDVDAIVPVPLHPKRKRARGYNQAALLARELGKWMQVPVLEDYLVRVKNTVPLKELNATERQNNLKKAFKVCGNDVKLERILVVDDICTTGSTLEEISTVLKEAGASEIFFAALAATDGGRNEY